MTTNNHGAEVYGGSGSDRRARRFRRVAGAAACPKTSRSRSPRRAPTTPRRTSASTGLYASRRNYDVARGVGADGSTCVGCARAILARRRRKRRRGGRDRGVSRRSVAGARARDDARGLRQPPKLSADAFVYFSGVDANVGALTKYAMRTDADRDNRSTCGRGRAHPRYADHARNARPGVLFVHGWGGDQRQYSRGRATWRGSAAFASRSTCAATRRRERSSRRCRGKRACATSSRRTTFSRPSTTSIPRDRRRRKQLRRLPRGDVDAQRPVKWLALRVPA